MAQSTTLSPDPAVELPYWDGYLRQLEAAEMQYDYQVLHSHVGCWDNPSWSNRVPLDYAKAAERMCALVCDAGTVAANKRVLDVGCGLGTVVASINARVSPIDLVGVNIDDRQLEIARRGVQPRPGNTVDFIASDACDMPLDDDSFDVLLALECSFHFPSREGFLKESRRVLRTGGRFALCEHFAGEETNAHSEVRRQSRIWGPFMEPCKLSRYDELAEAAGFRRVHEQDVTAQTIPTYPGIRKLLRRGFPFPLNWQAVAMMWLTEFLMRRGKLRYMVLAYEAV